MVLLLHYACCNLKLLLPCLNHNSIMFIHEPSSTSSVLPVCTYMYSLYIYNSQFPVVLNYSHIPGIFSIQESNNPSLHVIFWLAKLEAFAQELLGSNVERFAKLRYEEPVTNGSQVVQPGATRSSDETWWWMFYER